VKDKLTDMLFIAHLARMCVSGSCVRQGVVRDRNRVFDGNIIIKDGEN